MLPPRQAITDEHLYYDSVICHEYPVWDSGGKWTNLTIKQRVQIKYVYILIKRVKLNQWKTGLVTTVKEFGK
jgi:hypothetical protein